MGTISSTLAINDSMSATLRQIADAVASVTAGLEQMQRESESAVNPRDIQQATRALDQMQQEINITVNNYNQMEAAIDQATDALDQTERQQEDVNDALQDGQNSASGLWGTIKGFVAAYAGWEIVKQTVAWSDEMTNINARISAINDGTRTNKQLMDQIYKASQNSRASFQATADIIGRLGSNAREAFANNDEMVAFAEQLNKQFTISGAGAMEAEAATIQLVQGLGSGVLRGDELNSVFEQAPSIIRTIADHMGVPISQIRTLAEQGKITAQIVKDAMLGAAEETNKKFADMPLTFSAMWTMAKNTFQMQMMGLQKVLQDTFNSEQFQSMVNGITSAIVGVAKLAIPLIKGIAAAVGFLYRNWSFIAPVILSVVAAMLIYRSVTLATMAVEAVSKGIKMAGVIASYAKAAATGVEVSATVAATAAQWGLNTAMYACPLTWIILLIIALIAIIYLAVAAFNKIAGTSISATGIIMGAFAALGAFLWNLIVGIYNGFLATLDAMIDPVIGIIDWFYQAFTGGFEGIGGACLNILGKIISAALGVVKPILEIWDWVTGMNAAGAVEAAQKAASDWGKTPEGKKKSLKTGWLKSSFGADQKDMRIGYGDAWNAGYSTGDALSSDPMGSIKGALGGLADDPAIQAIQDDLAKQTQAAQQTAKNTTPKAGEDYQYLKQIMGNRAVDRLAGTDIKIQMNNNNKINSSLDIDNIVNQLSNRLATAMANGAEGSHR